MFGKINRINNNIAYVQNIAGDQPISDLMNVHVIFEDQNERVLGEVIEIDRDMIQIHFLGEYHGDHYVNGILRKPSLSSKIRIINTEELLTLTGKDTPDRFLVGESAVYKGFFIRPRINDFFSNHLAILGNSGSGKSCGVARLIQNLFADKKLFPYQANIFVFDAYGEYKNTFRNINVYNTNYQYKFITTSPRDSEDVKLQIPFSLLEVDDLSLLLQVTEHSQISIIEQTLRLTRIFSMNNPSSEKYKNHLIAKAILSILFNNKTSISKKNEIFNIIKLCHTDSFNFDTSVQGLGYTRKLTECFNIDSQGNFGESVLINEYLLRFIDESLEKMEPQADHHYTVSDFQVAFQFALISEGFESNQSLHDAAMMLKVRLDLLINSHMSDYFVTTEAINMEQFISNFVIKDTRKAQIININLEDIDDSYAKAIVKILSRMFFQFAKTRRVKASVPFHLVLEEAHHYIQKDQDVFLLGYNIFERIAKEGRKYGVLLDIISQRPVEISDTVISQISNFMIFKITHPIDVDYITKMLPNISLDIVEKQKSLQPGSCVSFGSAFQIPMIVKLSLPDPLPYSANCDIEGLWKNKQGG